jgi:hypothetical protein
VQSPDPPASSWHVRIGRGPAKNKLLNFHDINVASTAHTCLNEALKYTVPVTGTGTVISKKNLANLFLQPKGWPPHMTFMRSVHLKQCILKLRPKQQRILYIQSQPSLSIPYCSSLNTHTHMETNNYSLGNCLWRTRVCLGLYE